MVCRMDENNQKLESTSASDFEFLQEKIKERPIDKKKLFQRTVVTASLALLFGLVACLTFLLLEPVLNNWIYPEEEPNIVTFPQEEDEMLPEDMLTEGEVTVIESVDKRYDNPEDTANQYQEEVTLNPNAEVLQEQAPPVDPVEEEVSYIEEKQNLYEELYELYGEVAKSMVTVTGIKSDVDWFNNTYQSEGQIAGVIIANNNRELLILTKRKPLKDADSIQVTFCNNVSVEATLKEYDAITDLAVIAVDLKYIRGTVLDYVSVATLGSSADPRLPGTVVMAVGNVQGYKDNVCYGMITSIGNIVTLADSQYKLVTTDIYGSQNPTGILVNLKGQVIGWLDNSYNNSDTKNMVSAIGITELKGMITKISNGQPLSYVGLYVKDIQTNIRQELGIPQGAYVSDVDMDSPAMLNGVQKGDIIIQVGEKEVKSATDYMNAIRACTVGKEVEFVILRAHQETYEQMTITVSTSTK